MFDNSVPGLPEKAGEMGLTPLEYMRKFGAVEVDRDGDIYEMHDREVDADSIGMDGLARKDNKIVGAGVDGVAKTGFATESRKLEWWSKSMHDWGWEQEATPGYLKTHVYWRDMDIAGNERILPSDLQTADADPYPVR